MIHCFCSGVLLAAPQSRQSAKGTAYTTGVIRCQVKGDESTLVSLIAFSESVQAELLELVAGDALTVTGNGKLTQWTAVDGTEHHGLSIVADRILPHVPSKPKPKAAESSRPAPRRSPPKAAPVEQTTAEFEDRIPF